MTWPTCLRRPLLEERPMPHPPSPFSLYASASNASGFKRSSKQLLLLLLVCSSVLTMLSLSSPLRTPSSFAPAATPRPRLRVSASAIAMPASTTMYDLLSVGETARPDEIKAAYRRQALRWHPDACRCAGEHRQYAERFMRTREAYEVLSDPARRRTYDLSLSADRWAAAVGAASAFRSGSEDRDRRRAAGFGDWDAQLEVLRQRSAAAAAGGGETWASRMRRARRAASAV